MIPVRPRRVRRTLALVASGAVLAAVGIGFLFAPRAQAAPTASVLEPAYSAVSWWQFAGQVAAMMILSAPLALALAVAVFWVWEWVAETVLPIRRWLR